MVHPASILKQYWGYEAFRPLQEDIISSVLQGHDTLALLPTGGGKSICFQVPAMMREGICLVITPLIALMKDQVENLAARDIPACALHTGMGWRELELELENSLHGKYKFLYVSPERLQSSKFQAYARNMNISLIAVDEAHCISQWGYDFRPMYLKIPEFRSLFPKVNVIALTASATPVVVTDIQDKLSFRKNKVLSQSFMRGNLSYVLQYEENKREKIAHICKSLKGTGIVYMRNRKGTKDMAAFLGSKGISSDFYHAGLSTAERSSKQADWKNNKTRVMVCTNAFGMGIDKPDVRFVIHEQKPESMEAYYQEAGRAGRDGKKAYCILLSHSSDFLDDEKQLALRFPEPAEINSIYQAACNYLHIAVDSGEGTSYDFEPYEFASKYKLDLLKVHHTLQLLEGQRYLQCSEAVFTPSRLRIIVDYKDLYPVLVKNKELDEFFKLLTRSYGGIFDHYTSIREQELAKKLSTTLPGIMKILDHCKKLELIDYEPRKDKPQLVMTENRYPEIRFNASELEFLKGRFLERQQSVRTYCFNETVCRQQLLVKYFGEPDAAECGICDICLDKKKPPIDKARFSRLQAALKTAAEKGTLNMQNLHNAVPEEDLQDMLTVMRWLMDNKILSLDNKGTLTWKKGSAS